MKKIIILYIFSLILLSSFVSAELLDIQSIVINNAVAKEINMNATFNLTITNNNDFNELFWIDSVLDMVMFPSGYMEIPAMSSLVIPIYVAPSSYFKSLYSGGHEFGYFVKGLNSGTINKALQIKIVQLVDALQISIPDSVKMSDENMTITLENKENMWISGTLNAESDILSGSKEVEMEPLSKHDIDVPIKTVRDKAGKYLIDIKFATPDYTLDKKDDIVLEPTENIRSDESRTGSIFAYITLINKTNIGNIESDATIIVSKSAPISWFTTFSQIPEKVERSGLIIRYSWTKKLDLDESFAINVRTDYSLPLVVLIVLAAGLVFLYVYSRKQIIVTKRAVRVKTSTGEFALKILLHAKCVKGEAKEVIITDTIPIFSEFYEKSATLKPDRKIGRSLTWYLGNMIKGEEKTISYVIYSKVKVMGKIEMPVVRGTYKNIKDKLRHLTSNKLFILAEESSED
jgi:hypothetical protein